MISDVAPAATAAKRILMWHVHGSYATSLVQGRHTYFIPVLPGRGADGRGRARTWEWPDNAIEVTPADARRLDVDVVIVQRPQELDRLVRDWLGREPGRDIPAIYLEHDVPQGRVAEMRHPAAGRPDLTIVHVTHFNDLFWDCGTTPARVIEHGVVDPGYRYTGELPRAAVSINEARRRGRVTGTDLLARFGAAMPVDLFGIDAGSLGGVEDPPQSVLHTEMARRRVYLHPMRWTSLGLSLIEAMHLGMQVVALATTEAIEAVPPDCGAISTDVERLLGALRRYAAEPEAARRDGMRARAFALERYGLRRFLHAWDALLTEVTS
ncbi:MAG: glycosyl transferase, group 1 [Candidatus Eremiobacteraeota bacterium]|nr:glycosyl transferase, group 1 [Candidatus Eremiobacteraeota bacterium]